MRALRLTLITAVVALTAALVVLLRQSDTVLPELPSARDEPLLVPASAEREDFAHPVTLQLTYVPGLSVPAPAWGGIVTSLTPPSDGVLESGARPVEVDGVSRVALATASPFFRILSRNMRGPDVEELEHALVALGYLSAEPTGQFTATVEGAVRAFNESVGLGRVSSFDPAVVIWLPGSPFVVTSTHVKLGEPVPPQGAAVFSGPEKLASAVTLEPTSAVNTGDEWVVTVTGADFSFDPVQRAVRPDELPRLRDHVGTGVTEVAATAHLLDPARVVAVPLGAVVVGSDGVMCVWIQVDEAPGEMQRRLVEVGGGRVGVATVREGVEPGELVVANPARALRPAQCASS